MSDLVARAAPNGAEARQQERLYLSLIETMPDAVLVIEEGSRRLLLANSAAERLLGYSRDELLRLEAADLSDPTELARGSELQATLRAAGRWRGEWTMRRKDGRPVPTEMTVSRVTLGGRVIHQGIFRDISQRKRAERAQRILAEAGAALTSSLNYEWTLQSVTRLVVPALADWCVIDLKEEGVPLHRAALAHVDRAKEDRLREIFTRFPRDTGQPYGPALVARTGRPILDPEITDELLHAYVPDPASAAVIKDLGLASVMSVPLIARGRTIGSISFNISTSERRFDETDLALAEELARRVALAVDNAWLYRDARRARAQAELAHRKIVDALENVTDAFFALDRDWTFTYLNGEAERLLEVRREALVGRSVWDVVPRAEEAGFYRGLYLAMAEQVPTEFVAFHAHLDAWFEVHAYPGRDELSVYFRDVTERKRDEETLRRREQEFRALVEGAPDAILRFDRELRHVYVNPAVERATGLKAEDMIGKTDEELGFPPDLAAFWAEHLRQVFETGREHVIEFAYPPGGEPRYYHSRLVPELAPDETAEYVLAITRDITERKRAEEGLRLLAEAGAVLASSLDYQSTLQSVTRLVVSSIADWCTIFAVGGERTGRRHAIAHADPAKEELLRELQRRYPIGFKLTDELVRAWQTGRAQLRAEITDAQLASESQDAEHLRLIRAIGSKSGIVAPLSARERLVGVLYLSSSTRRYDEGDLALVEELARRAALAIDNARLYQRAICGEW